MSTSSCQLEIIFLTCRTATFVAKHIEKFSKNTELENLKVRPIRDLKGKIIKNYRLFWH